MKTKTQPCPECGGTMKFGTRSRPLKYRDLEGKVRVTGWWCESCGEGILTGDDLRKYSRALQDLKAKAEQVLPPAEVAAIREKLGPQPTQGGRAARRRPASLPEVRIGKPDAERSDEPPAHIARSRSEAPGGAEGRAFSPGSAEVRDFTTASNGPPESSENRGKRRSTTPNGVIDGFPRILVFHDCLVRCSAQRVHPMLALRTAFILSIALLVTLACSSGDEGGGTGNTGTGGTSTSTGALHRRRPAPKAVPATRTRRATRGSRAPRSLREPRGGKGGFGNTTGSGGAGTGGTQPGTGGTISTGGAAGGSTGGAAGGGNAGQPAGTGGSAGCGDTMSDPMNCGACGNACRSQMLGACAGGQCTPYWGACFRRQDFIPARTTARVLEKRALRESVAPQPGCSGLVLTKFGVARILDLSCETTVPGACTNPLANPEQPTWLDRCCCTDRQ